MMRINVSATYRKLIFQREFGQKKPQLYTNCQNKHELWGWAKKHQTFIDFRIN